MKIDLQNRPRRYAINVLVTIHPSNIICKAYANLRSQFNGFGFNRFERLSFLYTYRLVRHIL